MDVEIKAQLYTLADNDFETFRRIQLNRMDTGDIKTYVGRKEGDCPQEEYASELNESKYLEYWEKTGKKRNRRAKS